MVSACCQHTWKSLSAAWQGEPGSAEDNLPPDMPMQHGEGAVRAGPVSIRPTWGWGGAGELAGFVQQSLKSHSQTATSPRASLFKGCPEGSVGVVIIA